MKYRKDFVTNSSSSSYIVCFARIADEEKVKEILKEFESSIEIYTANEVLSEIKRHKCGGYNEWLEYDWADINATPDKNYIEEHINDRFVVIRDRDTVDLFEDESGVIDYDVSYKDFDTRTIDQITEKHGFSEIDVQFGAGRDG